MKRIVINTITMLAIFAASIALSVMSLDPLVRLGAFGGCSDGSCHYVAVYVGFPLIACVLFIIGIVAWFEWCRGRS